MKLAALLLSLVLLAPPVQAQSFFPDENGASLKGVTAFDAFFFVPVWLGADEEERDRIRGNGNSAFELALRRDGVTVDVGAPNYLVCQVTLANSGDGLIFYRYGVDYYAYNPDGLNILLWTDGGVATVGANKFSAEDVAQDCADTFANEWLKQNPGR